MQCLLSIFVIGAVVTWSGVLAVDCSDQEDLKREQNKCLTKFGLTSEGSIDQLQTDIQQNVNSTCGDISKYKDVLKCAMDVGRNCMIELGQDPDLIPSSQKMAEGLTYLCNHANEMDGQCLQGLTAPLQTCVENKARTANLRTADAADLVCMAFDWTISCMKQGMGSCPRTRDILVTYTSYTIPPACGTGSICPSLLVLALAAVISMLYGSSSDN